MEFECHFVLARVALIDVAERDLERVAVSGLERITGNGKQKQSSIQALIDDIEHPTL